jgi:oxygen-independent coproporphyrinogen III oxidase
MHPYSLYLHIPFCRHRCSYCDFNTYAGLNNLIPEYVQALCLEIEMVGQAAGERLPVHTVFFGGGTPSLLSADELALILKTLKASYSLQEGAEITLEANPGSLTAAFLQELRLLGINRLSLGMQSSNQAELDLLEREHSFTDVVQSVEWARQAGFDNLNLDLIYGLPYQTLQTWQGTMEKTIALRPEHLSLYALTIEHGTPMQHWIGKGLLIEPDPDLAADMYEYACEHLEGYGYSQYEISNWAGTDREGSSLMAQHNLQYWRNLSYLGFGAGAHGYAAGIRTANVRAPAAYIRRCQNGRQQDFPRSPAAASIQKIERQDAMGETMMMGLRLVDEGVSNQEFARRFELSLEQAYPEQIERLSGQGLLEWSGESKERLRLTRRGRLLGNQVFSAFI